MINVLPARQREKGEGGGSKAGKSGYISEKNTLFMPENSLGKFKGEQIIEKKLIYKSSHKEMESKSDRFYCLFNHSVQETAEIFASGGFTPAEFREYKEMYDISINEKELMAHLNTIRTITAEDLKREVKRDVIGRVIVPRWLKNMPINKTRPKRTAQPTDVFEVAIDVSYHGGISAQKIIQAVISIATILHNMHDGDTSFSIKAVNGTLLDTHKLDTDFDRLIIWNAEHINPIGSVYDWIHHFTPMNLRGIEFVWHSNLSKVYDLPKSIDKHFDKNGMGRPYPSAAISDTFYSLETLYENDPDIAEFDELIKSTTNSNVLFISASKVVDNYNALTTKDDIKSFVKDFNEWEKKLVKGDQD